MKTSLVLESEKTGSTGLSRGADARELLGLRERIDAFTSEQADAAKGVLAVKRADDDALAQEQALATSIDAEARALELDNHRRGVRLIALDAAAGLGSYMLASFVLDRPERSPQ